MSRLLSRYLHYLSVYPLPTKIVTSASLFGAGDVISQYVDGTMVSKNGFNQDRTMKAMVWGGIIFAPLAHVWYNKVLERFVPGTHATAVLTKVALDQTLWGVAINSLYLAYATVSINHGSVSDIEPTVRSKIWPLMKANWILWPAVQLINFKYVPPPLQVPFINVVVLAWSCYLALLATENQNNKLIEGSSTQRTMVDKNKIVLLEEETSSRR